MPVTDIPPVPIQKETSADFQHWVKGLTKSEAIAFKEKHGGIIVEDMLHEGKYIVVRIPK